MAMSRCLEHVPQNRGGSRIYSHYVEPVNHPNSGLICGKNGCEAPAYILLDDTDYSSFNKGNRIFGEPDRGYAKFRAEENSVLKALP
jgi:hypothetical protein